MAVTKATSSTGSGINVPEIVSGLMEVERRPVTKLQSQIDQETLVISTLGVFKSKVAALESAAKAIQTPGVFSLRSTTSSDSTKVSASASNAATTGAYTVKVAQTAQSETSMLAGFASTSQVVDLSNFSLTANAGGVSPVTYSPSYARIAAASFSKNDAISFTLKGGQKQTFTVTTQTTPTAVAGAINSAVIAGTLEGVTASVDADGYLQISSSNPLRGLDATLDTAGYATIANSVSYTAGKVLRFAVSGGAEQTFVVTTQDTVAKMAAAINDAVTAGTLSGVSASVISNSPNPDSLRITALDPSKTVSATVDGSAASVIVTAASKGAVSSVSTDLTSTATISNVRDWINDLEADLQATLVQRADGKYALNVSSKNTGSENAFSISGITTPDAQKDRITLSGTYSVDDVITLTINGYPLVYQVNANDLTLNGDGTGGAVAGNSSAAYGNIAKKLATAFEALNNDADTMVDALWSSATPAVLTLTAATGYEGTAFTTDVVTAKKQLAQWTSTAASSGVAQVNTVTLAGKYSAGDVITLTVNGIPLTYTVKSADINDDGNNSSTYVNVATALAAAFEASDTAADTAVDASVTAGVFTLTATANDTAFSATASAAPAKPVAIRAASVANSSVPAVAQVDTIALSGKYSAGDVITLNVNGVTLSYTVTAANVATGGDNTTDYQLIAQALANAHNASSNVAHTPVSATASSGVLSLTANTAGTGFSAAVSVRSATVVVGGASRTAVVANVLDRGITAIGAGTVAATATANKGDYSAVYDGTQWVVTAPSGTFSATLAANALTLASGSVAITVSGVSGTPKTGDKVLLTVNDAGTSVTSVAFTEHAAIELQSSRDAFFSINGTAVQRSTNKINDVISGVTFDLNAPVVPNGGAVTSLSSVDFSAASSTVINVSAGAEDLSASAVSDFVTAYNDLLSFYKTESASSTDSAKRGVLNTDSTLRTFMDRLRGLYARGIQLSDGSTISFSSIGVEFQRDGSLYLDKGALNTAVSNGLQSKFAAGVTLGYESSTVNLTSFLTSSLRTTGIVSTRISDVEDEQARLQERVTDWESKLTRIQDRYYRQYAALDALLFKLQNTSNALTSAIDSLVNSQKNG